MVQLDHYNNTFHLKREEEDQFQYCLHSIIWFCTIIGGLCSKVQISWTQGKASICILSKERTKFDSKHRRICVHECVFQPVINYKHNINMPLISNLIQIMSNLHTFFTTMTRYSNWTNTIRPTYSIHTLSTIQAVWRTTRVWCYWFKPNNSIRIIK